MASPTVEIIELNPDLANHVIVRFRRTWFGNVEVKDYRFTADKLRELAQRFEAAANRLEGGE